VALAVAECAFVTSELPVVLSLEMHCNSKQQRQLAELLTEHLGDNLFTYDELTSTDRASLPSPLELERRVLVKGKVKPGVDKPRTSSCLRRATSKVSSPFRRKQQSSSQSSTIDKGWSSTSFGNLQECSSEFSLDTASLAESSENRESYPEMRCSEVDDRASSAAGRSERRSDLSRAQQTMEQKHRLSKRATHPIYEGVLTVRASPLPTFLGAARPKWPITITSLSEDKLLASLGVPKAERKQIESLVQSASVHDDPLKSRALIRLAADPPLEAGRMQRRTAAWLLRPFPLGTRFSGKNMSPLPGWLCGGQSVCLNFSEVDLAVSLHFALFKGSAGYILKPAEMLVSPSEVAASHSESPGGSNKDHKGGLQASTANDAYWPPWREEIHRTSVKFISLHNLPKVARKARAPSRHEPFVLSAHPLK